jgi:hypothetical protein
MNVPDRATAVVVIGILCVACTLTACEKESRREVIDGVEHVFHPAKAKPANIELSVELTIGEEFGEDYYVLGEVGGGVALDDSGNVYIPDTQKHKVQVYSPEGSYVRTLGQEGSGPGEYQYPITVVPMRTGEIIVADAGGRKLLYFDAEGTHLRDLPMLPPSPGPPFMAAETSDGHVVGVFFKFRREKDGFKRGAALEKIDPRTGESVVVYYERLEKWRPRRRRSRGIDNMSIFAMDGDDRVFRSEINNERYFIERYEPAGELSLVIEKAFEQVKKTAAELEEERAISEARKMMTGAPVTEPEPYKSAVGALGVDHEGRLWVQLGTTEMDQPPEFDVFASDGEYIGRVVPQDLAQGVELHMLGMKGDKLLATDPNPEDAVRLYILSING